MEIKEFDEEIEKYLNKISVNLEKKQKEQLYDFMNVLIEKNREMNLTAITEEKEIILKHFIDCIIIEKYIKDEDRIIDVGTGAGFPGIPIKIVKNKSEVFLIDSLNKRINRSEERRVGKECTG